MSHRHHALVSQRNAEKTKLRIEKSDRKYQQHLDQAHQKLKHSIEDSLERIMHAGKKNFRRGCHYYSSPFSSYNEEIQMETLPIEDKELVPQQEWNVNSSIKFRKPNVVDGLHPQPRMVENLVPIEYFVTRHAPNSSMNEGSRDTTKNVNRIKKFSISNHEENVNKKLERDVPLPHVLQIDKEERHKQVLRNKSDRMIGRNNEKREHKKRDLIRKSSLMSNDASYNNKNDSVVELGDDYYYIGHKARIKYFEDLKSYTKSDFDHKRGITRNKKLLLKKQTSIHEKKINIQLINDERRNQKHLINNRSSTIATSNRIKKKNTFQEKRENDMASSHVKSFDELYNTNWSDYINKDALTNRNETIILSKKNTLKFKF